ncbi:MAG TPA: hypothetical protein VGB53_01940 [Rubricoccaceae bacterium]|jgi:hypothetical protein
MDDRTTGRLNCGARGGYGARVQTLAAVALAAFALGPALPAAAQAVVPVQGLTFGLLLPGVPETVGPDDVWRRAEVRVEGSGPVEVRFLLPDALHAGGARLPFRLGEATVSIGDAPPVPFDPAAPLRVTIPPAIGSITFYVGGTATASTQNAGAYEATLSVVATATDG